MSIELGRSTNKGTALLKLVHQFQPNPLFKDDYISWFFDESIVGSLGTNPLNLDSQPKNEEEQFQKIAYWYIVLREKHGDETIEEAIASGCKQLLLLGSGYDTRFFRLPCIRENSIATFEIDLPVTIEDKHNYIAKKLGAIPPGLSLIPLDFNNNNFSRISEYGFDKQIPTVYVWQGVSYYLPLESVSHFLDLIKSQMTPSSIFVFDCCSPLMTFKNDRIPGIVSQVDKLQEIGEPYQFGMESDEMAAWLKNKGFRGIQIWQQDDLEARFLGRRTLPNNMWYIVTTKV
ncbi:class I SAM-dependent methyltransferase [Aerosakkonemataceae cyanobacterium BLCC-F50]|uniref:S-adenosyl-L-methionine-dependent methyltransferase n=1 Tax=Floridaenema flaviceps BLCC-F50 TaxID=3153642 RepID=A0ABV4Y3E6_9CYAN